MHSLNRRLARVFGTNTAVLPFTTSGTGGLEAAVVNTVCPGDRVLAISIGYFGDRFASVAEAYGAQVVRWQIPWGRAAGPDELRRTLRKHRDLRAVLLTHNETSTGAANPLSELCQVIRQESAALILVDVVSSLGAMPVDVDRNGIDVAVGVPQKALMAPPGLALISASPRAMDVAKSAAAPRFSLDFGRMATAIAEGTTTYTPPVTVLYGLDAALSRIEAERLPAVYERHERLAAFCRSGVEPLGLRLAASKDCYSPTVTAVRLPEGLPAGLLRQLLEREHSIMVSSARTVWANTHIRIGHMGWVSEAELAEVVTGLETLLRAERIRH